MRPGARVQRTVARLAITLGVSSGFGLALPACVAPRAAEVRDPGPGPAPERPRPLSGRLATRYRGRFVNGIDDHDLYETVDLAYDDPAGRFKGSLLARAALDLDGRDAEEDARFFGLLDTYDHRLEPQLYHAWVEVEQGPLARVRLGRQPLYETPVTVVFDGLRAESRPLGKERVVVGGYAGAGEHPYESSSRGDLVLGTFGAARTWPGAELRLDWMHLEDARLGVDHEDDLLALSLSQELVGTERVTRLDARLTRLEGERRDLRLAGSVVDSDAGTTLQASLYRLLRTQRELAAPLDPFSDTLFELFPYTQVGLSASKDWDHLGLLGGADVRRVDSSADEGTYNHEFERYWVTGSLTDALPVSLSLTGEVWRASDTDYETWGASLTRSLPQAWELSLGSYYSLYEYDLFTPDERDHVRTTYIDLRRKDPRSRRWALRYEFERNDTDDFHTLRLDYSWTF